VGEYTVIHAGFALNRISEQEALETLEILQQIAADELETGEP